MLSKLQSNAVVQGLLQGDESGKGPLLFFITSSDSDRGLVSALHIGGPSFDALRVGSRLHMVVEEGENSIRFDASVLDLHPPDKADFMVLSSASVSGKRGYSRVEDHLCYECEVIRGTEEEAKERFRKKGSRRSSPQATALAAFATREDRAGISDLDREVVRLLAGLDAKVDAILRFLSLGDRAGLAFFAPRWISISGSGARFLVNEPVGEADFVDVRIQVPDMLSTPVAALGKVVRLFPLPAGGGKGSSDVAISFLVVSDEDRARIARYVSGKIREAERRTGGREGKKG